MPTMPTMSVHQNNIQKFKWSEPDRLSGTESFTVFFPNGDGSPNWAIVGQDPISGFNIPVGGSVVADPLGNTYFVVDVAAETIADNPNLYLVEISYKRPARTGISTDPDLTKHPPEWVQSTITTRESIVMDYYNQLICFSSREPADIQEDVKEAVYTITKYIRYNAYNPRQCEQYIGATNNASFTPNNNKYGPWDKGMVKILDWRTTTPTSIITPANTSIKMEIVLHIRNDGWLRRIADKSTYVWQQQADMTYKMSAAIDPLLGTKYESPTRLNGMGGLYGTSDGQALPSTTIVDVQSGGVFLKYQPKSSAPMDFSVLGI